MTLPLVRTLVELRRAQKLMQFVPQGNRVRTTGLHGLLGFLLSDRTDRAVAKQRAHIRGCRREKRCAYWQASARNCVRGTAGTEQDG